MADGCASWMMSAAAPPLSETFTSVSCCPAGTAAIETSMPVASLNGAMRRLEVVALAADPLGLHGDPRAGERLVGSHGLVELGIAVDAIASWAATPMLLNVRAIVASAAPATAVFLCAVHHTSSLIPPDCRTRRVPWNGPGRPRRPAITSLRCPPPLTSSNARGRDGPRRPRMLVPAGRPGQGSSRTSRGERQSELGGHQHGRRTELDDVVAGAAEMDGAALHQQRQGRASRLGAHLLEPRLRRSRSWGRRARCRARPSVPIMAPMTRPSGRALSSTTCRATGSSARKASSRASCVTSRPASAQSRRSAAASGHASSTARWLATVSRQPRAAAATGDGRRR